MSSQQIQLEGVIQHSALVLTSNKYHYLVWLILGITLISLALYNTVTNMLVIMVSLLVLYFGLTIALSDINKN